MATTTKEIHELLTFCQMASVTLKLGGKKATKPGSDYMLI